MEMQKNSAHFFVKSGSIYIKLTPK